MRADFPRPDAASARRGLTLVELMVVAAVLAAIGSLVLGAIGFVRRQVLQTACLSNLRQVGAIAGAYADEHGGRYPAESNKGVLDPEESPAWFYRLPAYLDQDDVRGTSIFQCPAFEWQGAKYFSYPSPKSYKLNGYLDNQGRPPRYLLGSARDEGAIVFFADAVAGEAGMGQWGHLPHSAIDPGRHAGRVNVLHLDGHGSTTVEDRTGDWEAQLRWTSHFWGAEVGLVEGGGCDHRR